MDPIEAASQLGQIGTILGRFAERLESIEDQMQQQDFTLKQIAPILSGTRVDIVAMRATLLRIEEAIKRVPIDARMVSAPARIAEETPPHPDP